MGYDSENDIMLIKQQTRHTRIETAVHLARFLVQ
jgi:hypothetical protein